MLSSADMSLPADIRTAAAYGLGVCAAKLGPAAAPFGSQIMSTLLGLLRHPESRVGDNEDATDNVVSALGKVCLHQSVEGAQAVLPEWLSYLPLKSDLEEAAQVHEQLVSLSTNSLHMQLAFSRVTCYACCTAVWFDSFVSTFFVCQCAFLERDAESFLAPAGSVLQVATALSLGLKEEQHTSKEVEHRMQSWCVRYGACFQLVRC
jgi:hypothetical protein